MTCYIVCVCLRACVPMSICACVLCMCVYVCRYVSMCVLICMHCTCVCVFVLVCVSVCVCIACECVCVWCLQVKLLTRFRSSERLVRGTRLFPICQQ